MVIGTSCMSSLACWAVTVIAPNVDADELSAAGAGAAAAGAAGAASSAKDTRVTASAASTAQVMALIFKTLSPRADVADLRRQA
jgi:hypothetical protein